jgi:TPR repeat protein
MEWYTKAAEKENGLGLCYLGICYRNGVVTDQDTEKAIELFTKAADQGYADGQWLLGDYYYFTEEEQDFEKAVRWYEKAVEQGHTTAQYGLGNC